MRIKVLVFVLLLACGIALPLCAQGPGGPPAPPSPEQQLQRLDEKLALTDDQKTQVLQILTERSDAMKTLMEDQSASMPDKFSEMIKLRDASNSRIRELLNPDQQATFDKMVAEEAARMGHGPGNGPTDGPPDGSGPPPEM